MKKNDLLIQARKEILIEGDCKKALDTLNSIHENGLPGFEKMLFLNTLALACLENEEYIKAAGIYRETGEKYHAGFCELLAGNESEAEQLWGSAPESGPCLWGKCLLNFINMKKGPEPTFLQIRNHLELDIGYFIRANRIRYAENLIKHGNIFIGINLESYKLIGRVLLNFGFLNQAKKHLWKSLEVLPHDFEAYYLLGRYNYLIGAYGESRKALERSLEYNFFCNLPAFRLLEKLKAGHQL